MYCFIIVTSLYANTSMLLDAYSLEYNNINNIIYINNQPVKESFTDIATQIKECDTK